MQRDIFRIPHTPRTNEETELDPEELWCSSDDEMFATQHPLDEQRIREMELGNGVPDHRNLVIRRRLPSI